MVIDNISDHVNLTNTNVGRAAKNRLFKHDNNTIPLGRTGIQLPGSTSDNRHSSTMKL